MLGTNKMGTVFGNTVIEYVVQSKKYDRDWEDTQWINTLDQEVIKQEMEKWRRICPDSKFRAIKREITITDLESAEEQDFEDLVEKQSEFYDELKRLQKTYKELFK